MEYKNNTGQFTEVNDYHDSWYVVDACALEPLQWIPGLHFCVHPSICSLRYITYMYMLKIRHMDEATKTMKWLNSIWIIRPHTIDM